MNEDGTKSTAVANYYTKEQGARFSSLLGVWELDNNGDEVFVSFNDKRMAIHIKIILKQLKSISLVNLFLNNVD